MRKLDYFDIKEREKNLNSIQTNKNTAGISIPYLFESLGERYSYNNAKLVLENWNYLSKYELESLDKVLETFLIICENDSNTNIRNAAAIIESKILHKVRDGRATRHLNNYKLGKFKIYNTKINNRVKESKDNVKNAIKNKGKTVNIFHPNRKYEYDIYGRRYSELEKKKLKEREKTVSECFDSFIDISNCNDQCDRVLQNQKILSSRYNMDSKVRSCNALDENNIIDCIYELCEMIDGYDVSDIIKYNIGLENIKYTMNKNCINVSNSLIAETVSNYFLFSRNELDEDFMHDMRYVLEYSKFYNEDDLYPVRYIYKEEESVEIVDSMDYIDSLLENTSDRIQMRKEINKNKKNNLKSENNKNKKNKDDDFKKELNKFKLKNNKTIEDFKKIIIRFFASPKENIIKGFPDIFDIIRMALVISTFKVSLVIGLIALITNELLKINIRREEAVKILKEYDKQIARYKKKLENSSSDKANEKYEAVLDKLESERRKYSDYTSKLFTEEEYNKMTSNNEDIDYTLIAITNQFDSLIESMKWDTNEIMKNINKNVNNFSSEDIYTITESVLLCPDVFNVEEYRHILENSRSYYRERPSLSSYITIDALNNCIYQIDRSDIKHIHLDEAYHIDKIYNFNNFYQEVVNDTIELINFYNYNVINEFQIKPKDTNIKSSNTKNTNSNNKFILSNTKDKIKKNEKLKNVQIPDPKKTGLSINSKLKIAQTQLQRSANELKDKEKTLSNKIDVNMSQFMKSAEKALTNDNREAVIKGSLIPSASKCIKAAIVTGAAYLVSPALAIIGALGAIGISKKLQRKERQLILDDIDIELEMCEKYLKIAEEKDDMKATRNLLQTKRALQRQQQRLKYSMSVDFETPPPKIKNNDEISESYVMLPELGG